MSLVATVEGGEPNDFSIAVYEWYYTGRYENLGSSPAGEEFYLKSPGIYSFAPILDLPDNVILVCYEIVPTIDVVVVADIDEDECEDIEIDTYIDTDADADAVIEFMPFSDPTQLSADLIAAGFRVEVVGNTVVVNDPLSGYVPSRTTPLVVNIAPGLTVEWRAIFRGSANPLIDYIGNGTLEVGPGAWIENTGSGSYTAIRAQGAALVVTGGTVQSGSGRAIEGSGAATTVTVKGNGSVFNQPTNNLFPAIDMTNQNNTGLNVIVEYNGSVFGISYTGLDYTIQTYGNVDVNGGMVSSFGQNGRAINLVGMNSTATVRDGVVAATGAAGVAISTATTNPANVANASVVIEGGLVYSTATGNGWAIHTTGNNSTVTVSGGVVFAYGVNMTGSGGNSVIFTQNHPGSFTGPTGDGIIIAWDESAGVTDYDANTTTHIQRWPAAASAVWGVNSYGNGGIAFANGSNTGFVEFYPLRGFEDITIHFRAAAISPANIVIFPAATVGYGVQPSQTFTITNTGTDPITNLAASFAAGAGSAFEFAAPLPVSSIGPGQQATLQVRPQTGFPPGLYLDTLIVSGDNIANLTVHLSFRVHPMHTITATAGTGGSITPSGAVSVSHGGSQVHRIVADDGWHIKDVLIDGNSIGPVSIHRFYNVRDDHTIHVVFEQNPSVVTTPIHIIVASAGANGSITPQGSVQVYEGSDETFTITPNPGYYILDVLVDGLSVGPVNTYTFSNVTSNRTIHAKIEREAPSPGVHIITANTSAGGRISPSGNVQINDGDDRDFMITANPGYHIQDILVDGSSIGSFGTQSAQAISLTNVTMDHTIFAEFSRNSGGSNSGGQNNGRPGSGGQGSSGVLGSVSSRSDDDSDERRPGSGLYLLVVENGIGGGWYVPGTVVTIKAQDGLFNRWEGGNGGVFANAYNPETTFTMPARNARVTATYHDLPQIPQNVNFNPPTGA